MPAIAPDLDIRAPGNGGVGTINQAQATVGTNLLHTLGYIANQIKNVKGTTNWDDDAGSNNASTLANQKFMDYVQVAGIANPNANNVVVTGNVGGGSAAFGTAANTSIGVIADNTAPTSFPLSPASVLKNKVIIRNASTGDAILSNGKEVYGRLTVTGTAPSEVFTLYFYQDESTAYTFNIAAGLDFQYPKRFIFTSLPEDYGMNEKWVSGTADVDVQEILNGTKLFTAINLGAGIIHKAGISTDIVKAGEPFTYVGADGISLNIAATKAVYNNGGNLDVRLTGALSHDGSGNLQISAAGITESYLSAGVQAHTSEPFFDDGAATPTATASKGFIYGTGSQGLVEALATPGAAVRVQVGGTCFNHLGARISIPTSASLAIVARTTAGNTRKDIIVVSAAGVLTVRQGTEGASPADPTLTAGDVVLARVLVDDEAILTVEGADITDLRQRTAVLASKVTNYAIPTGTLTAQGTVDDLTDNIHNLAKAIQSAVGGTNWDSAPTASLNTHIAAYGNGSTQHHRHLIDSIDTSAGGIASGADITLTAVPLTTGASGTTTNVILFVRTLGYLAVAGSTTSKVQAPVAINQNDTVFALYAPST